MIAQNLGILFTSIFNPMHDHTDKIHNVITSIFLTS
jgi:hypothetical protein